MEFVQANYYLARNMSSIRMLRVCSRQGSPEEAQVYRALDNVIQRIYRNEVKNDQICMISQKLKGIPLSMKEVENSIMRRLGGTCINYRRGINAEQKKIMRTRKQTIMFLRASRIWMKKGQKMPSIDSNPYKFQLVFKIYQKYLRISIANKKIVFLWHLLEHSGNFDFDAFHNPPHIPTEIQLNTISLLSLIPNSILINVENFGTVLKTLYKQSQQRQKGPLRQMLNVYDESNRLNLKKSAPKMHNKQTDCNKGTILTKDNDQEIIILKVFSQRGCSAYDFQVTQQSSQIEDLITDDLIYRTGRLLEKSYEQLLKEKEKMDHKDTEDQSRPPSVPKKKNKKKRKNRKSKSKKKHQNMQLQEEQNYYNDQQRSMISKLILGKDNVSKKSTKQNFTSKTSQQKQQIFNISLTQQQQYITTVQMLNSMVIQQKQRSKCAVEQNTIDWWKSRVKK